MSSMQPLKDEHAELLPHIDRLRAVADLVGEADEPELAREVADVHRFLVDSLIPHAKAEDEVLYPVVARLLGGPCATATMSRDHLEVGQLTAELGKLADRLAGGRLDEHDAKALRRVLYGLYTLVGVHFAKEEEVYVPLLERGLSAEEAHELFEAMSATAHHPHA
jgi:iron-sulfur cluster repair protein YtfE (RIC family)